MPVFHAAGEIILSRCAMRIGYVVGEFPKHSETFILNEMAELIRLGHEVHVFPLFHPREDVIQPEIQRYQILSKTHFRPGYLRLAGELPGRFRQLGVRHRPWKHKLIGLAAAGYFARCSRPFHIELWHAHFANEPAYTAQVLSRITGLPFTFTAHAFDIYIHPDVLALRRRMTEAAAVVTPSHYNREYLHHLTGVPQEKIHIVRACAAIDRFADAPAQAEDPYRIIGVGRLVDKKGFRYAIQAVKELAGRYPHIQFHLVGTGPLQPELQEQVRTLGLEQHVRFLGALDGEKLKQEISRAAIMVLPCIRSANNDHDVCPLVLQEAMLLQKPVVATRLGSIPELIEHGQEGLLVEPGQASDLAHALETLFTEPETRRRMGQKGREKIQQHFNLHREVGKLVSLWERILQQESGAAVATPPPRQR